MNCFQNNHIIENINDTLRTIKSKYMLTFYIDKENRLIIEKYTGITRIATVATLMVNIWKHPDYEQNYDRIVEFQDLNLVFSKEEFQQFTKIISENSNSMRGRAAVLVREPSTAAIVSMYEDQMNHLHKVDVFFSESEVMNYLNIDNSIFGKIKGSDVVVIDLEE